MLPTSNIKKGKRFENFISSKIEAEGLGRSTRTPGSGSGNRFKGDLFNNLDFLFELKNQKTIHLLEWIDQAKREAQAGNYDPDKWALVFRDPRKPEFDEVYAVIDFGEFLELLKKNSEPLIKEPDRQASWHIRHLIQAAKEVLKDLE